MEELYRSDSVVVRRVSAEDRTRWVVTFDNFGIGAGFNRSGFGEAFFRSRGISAIHVLGRSDDWYQYDDMPLALKAVRVAVAGSDRVMTYGSSMGGYAAIRFADRLGANAVLALSPQYSIDPAKTPFDDRWNQDSHRIKWLPEIDGPVVCQCRPVIVFDPKSRDGSHVLRLSKDIQITGIPLPYSGHPATTYLQEANLLEPMILAVLDDTLDPHAAQAEARRTRKTNMAYLNELTRIQPPHRKRMGLRLARHAFELAADNPNAMWGLANQLVSAGHHGEARALFGQALSLAGRLPTLLTDYANGLVAAGDIGAARQVAAEVLSMNRTHAHVWAWSAHISWLAGEMAAAEEAIDTAMALDPVNAAYPEQKRAYERVRVAEPTKVSLSHGKWLVAGLRWACQRYQSMPFHPSRIRDSQPK